MKKIFLSIILAISIFGIKANAQGLFDASIYSDYGIVGSARYMSMAGSFGALGGEVCAALDNPAALGIFRSSEISVSAGVNYVNNRANWQNTLAKGALTNFRINNLSWVFHYDSYRESGYLSSNLSFGYQRIKDFNRNIVINNDNFTSASISRFIADYTTENGLNDGQLANIDVYNDVNIGWLSILGYDAGLMDLVSGKTDQWTSTLDNGEKVLSSYYAEERGSIDDYNFTYSGNVNDIVYFGTGISIQSISHTIDSHYYEDFEKGGGLDLNNYIFTSGVGVNFKIGAIVRPVKFLRLGLGFTSPTYYAMTDKLSSSLSSAFVDYEKMKTPSDKYFYNYHSPLKFQASAGFIFGKTAAINLDYQFANNKGMNFSLSNKDYYSYANQDIRYFAKNVHTIKAGAEFRVAERIRLRGGFAYISSPLQKNIQKVLPLNSIRTDAETLITRNSFYGSAGVGFILGSNISLDLTYALLAQNQTFTPFATELPEYKANLKNLQNNFLATFAVRY
jgi:hypothetical protein